MFMLVSVIFPVCSEAEDAHFYHVLGIMDRLP